MHASTHRHRARDGQAIIFVILAVVILFFVVLWNFDLHKTLFVKMRSQNGGDAAAVIAARWQGITLNLVGDLNIMNALALSVGDTQTSLAVSNVQARLPLFGPMIAFMAAQQGAKNNGMYAYQAFTDIIRDHAHIVRTLYPEALTPEGDLRFPEPYPGAWEDYADMLDLAADEGIAAAPENARFFTDPEGDHILLTRAFYEAIAGRSWCWFYHNAPGLLEDYTDYTWWPDLPELHVGEYLNSEIFGLGLTRHMTTLSRFTDAETVDALAAERGLAGAMSPTGMQTTASWTCYGPNWTAWTAMDVDGPFPFPAAGRVRPQYDYAGADAAVRVVSPYGRLTPGAGGRMITNQVIWTAAAKPFGYLSETDRPNSFTVVLPAFHDARLIPLDASSRGVGGGFDPEWRRFVEQELPLYVATGQLGGSTWYSTQLRMWEDASFRQDGVDWLDKNSEQCIAQGGGPGGPGGGRRSGH